MALLPPTTTLLRLPPHRPELVNCHHCGRPMCMPGEPLTRETFLTERAQRFPESDAGHFFCEGCITEILDAQAGLENEPWTQAEMDAMDAAHKRGDFL